MKPAKPVKPSKAEAVYVFTTNGEAPSSGFSKSKRAIDEKMLEIARRSDPNAAVRPWRFHDLRRTLASGLAELGIRQEVTEAALNHKSGIVSGVGGVYNRYEYAAEKRIAMDKWSETVKRMVSDDKNSDNNIVPLRA